MKRVYTELGRDEWYVAFMAESGVSARLRKDAGWSLRRTAKHLGLCVETVRRWESPHPRGPLRYNGWVGRYASLLRSWHKELCEVGPDTPAAFWASENPKAGA